MIGRKEEQAILERAYLSKDSEFLAVYGRRRIGKTYLIREFFKDKILFHHTGTEGAGFKEQLASFRQSLIDAGLKDCDHLHGWMEAFISLRSLVEKSNSKRKVIFIDEVPWMDTPRSNFVHALEHFWNAWMSARKDVVLIICGSATSWIINKVFCNRGGLHNRVTCQIPLAPFSLAECEEFSRSLGLSISRMDIAVLYMVFGGVAYYWQQLKQDESVAQAIDRLFFHENAPLKYDLDRIFSSLFKKDGKYLQIICAIAKRGKGLTMAEILSCTGSERGGTFTAKLEELEQCGFIRRSDVWGNFERHARYYLTDNFTIFSLRFLHGKSRRDSQFWMHSMSSGELNAWRGLAFESLCLLHVNQIKQALGISGIATCVNSWTHVPNEDYPHGAQIDLIIDRGDRIINVCEMKYTTSPYAISKKYLEEVTRRIETFRQVEKITRTIHLTFVSASGICHNSQAHAVQATVTLDDLFLPTRKH